MSTVVDTSGLPESVVVKRVVWRLLPYCMLLFIIAAIDRTNVGFAALQMNQQLGIGPAVFGFGAGVFFIGYALFEVPSNMMLARVGARRWISRIMVTWGVIVVAMAWVEGPKTFYLGRFLLGVAEAGFLPGILYYLNDWIPARYRAHAFSILLCGPVAANMLSGPIAAIILSLDGWLSLPGWRLLFILEGIPAVLLGFANLFIMKDTPQQAKWLSPAERDILAAAKIKQQKTVRALSFRSILNQPVVWQLVAFNFCLQIANYGVSLWMPQIIRSFGSLTSTQIGLLSSGPYILATVGMLLWGWHSDATHERRLHLVASISLAAVGLVFSALAGNPVLAYVGICLAAVGITGNFGVFWAVPGQYIGGRAAAAGLALISSMGQIGGFVGPYIVGVVREHSQGFAPALLVLAGAAAIGALIALSLGREKREPEPVAQPT
jgi:MFS family permease